MLAKLENYVAARLNKVTALTLLCTQFARTTLQEYFAASALSAIILLQKRNSLTRNVRAKGEKWTSPRVILI